MAIRRKAIVVFVVIVAVQMMFSSSLKNQIKAYSNDFFAVGGDPPPLPLFVKKSFRTSRNASSVGWHVWNRSHVLHSDKGWECEWSTFRTKDSQHEIPMCIHNGRDIISGSIRRIGRWRDCDELTNLWTERAHKSSSTVYIEIGANIGSCVLQMLLTTKATIVAFEPHPKNQFCLTSTLLKMAPAEYRNRVWFFPLGLGNVRDGQSVIRAATNNWGNSIVGGKAIKDGPNQRFSREIPIALERLDDVLDATQFQPSTGTNSNGALHTVPLMKMDAQGFECYILEGMSEMLKSIGIIKTEMDEKFLVAFDGCSDEILLDQLRNASFGVFHRGRLIKGSPPKKGYMDVVARARQS